MKYHITAFLLGFLLDLLLGDPYRLPHPVRFIGWLIAKTEKLLTVRERNEKKEFYRGIWLVIIVSGITLAATALLLLSAYLIHPFAGTLAETVMTYQILAAKCLKQESMKVYRRLKAHNLEEARRAVSMIVGRDTDCLDEEGVARAAVETVAENTSDGVIAPLLYTALAGPVLGLWYKAVNTMDSTVGYKNEKYLYFGRAAAKLDDLVNFIPSRVSAWLMITACFLGGKQFSGKGAVSIYKRDNRNHASPNSAQTESVCAGALGIQLGGDGRYFGRLVNKPCIGDRLRKVEAEDIRRVNRLMYLTAWLGEFICIVVMLIVLKIY